jgi:hypothetical protein
VVAAARADDALAHHAVARRQVGDVGTDLDDLAGPLVARDDRIGDRDDVPALIQLEVRVADAHGLRAHQHVVGPDGGLVDVGDDRLVGRLEDQGLHVRVPLRRNAP